MPEIVYHYSMEHAPAGLSGFLSGFVKRFRMKKAARFVREGDCVLDLGCGLGEVVHFLPPCNYLGVDRDDYMIERNRERYPGRKFEKLDILKDPLPAGPWDVLLLLALLEHLKDPALLLRQSVSLLKPGGRLVITTPHPCSDLPHRVLSFLHILSPLAQGEHHHLLGAKDLGRLADDLEMDLLCYKRFLMGMNQLAVFSTRNNP